MTERRRVLQVIAGSASAAAAGLIAVPAVGLVVAPAHTDPPQAARVGGTGPDAGWTILGRLDDLPVGQAVQLPVIGAEVDAWSVSPDRRLGAVWVKRHGEGADTLRAFSAVCPHLGCLIEREGDRYSCPCHVSSFDNEGRALEGPSPRGMDPLEVRVRDGAVMVRWERFRLGVPERTKVG